MAKYLLGFFFLSFFLFLGPQSSYAQACLPTYTFNCSSNDVVDDFSTTGGIVNITNNNTGCNGTLPNNYTIFPMTVSQIQGLNINISVLGSSNIWNQGFRIFVDWNQDNDFLDLGEDVWNSGGVATALALPFTGTFAVPFTAVPGNCKMRVVGRFNIVPTGPCDAGSFGEAEEYTVQVIPATPCTTVTGGTAVASPASPCPGTTFNLNLTGNTLASGLTYLWLESTVSAAGPYSLLTPSVTLQSANIPAPAVQTWYRCVVTCTSTSNFDTSAAISVTAQPFSPYSPCYCPPIYTNGGAGDAITNVDLGTLSNNTAAAGNPNPFWVDYTPLQAPPGNTLNIPIITINFATNLSVTMAGDGNQFSAVWIDFNQNTVFEAAEYYSLNTNAGANGTSVIPITLPSTALPGLTRMRVRGGDDVAISNTQGCNTTNSTWGETEDYVVNVLAAGPHDPAITNIQAFPSAGCMDSCETVVVTLSNFGSTLLDLSINPVEITLNVTGPNGTVSYIDTADAGFLAAYNANSTFLAFPCVNFYEGGCYSINTDTLTILGGSANANLINDSLFAPLVICNTRPNNGGDYTLCLGDTIPTGQGLSIINCPTALVQDSVLIPFTVNFVGNTPPSPTNCVPLTAGDFASGIMPSLPNGANILNGEISANNLQIGPLTFTTNPTFARISLYNGGVTLPTTAANVYHNGVQGTTSTSSFGCFNYLSTPSALNLNSMYNPDGTPVVPTVNMGHWASNRCFTPTFLTNCGGTTVVYLKLVYEYVPMGISWYEQSTGGIRITDSSVLNPLTTTNTIVSNSNTLGTYTFYGACAADTNCRVAVNMIVTGLTRDSIVVSDVLCNGDSNGTITAYVSGGTPGYQYFLRQGATVIDSNITGFFDTLAAGTYIVNVLDTTGCNTGDTTIIIGEPTPLVIDSIVSTSPSCIPGGDGTMTVYASGGTSAYQSYDIGSGPQISNVFTNLSGITYTVTVTDANGCTVSSTHSIVTPVGPTWASVASTDALCNGDTSGTITVSGTAGSSGIASYSSTPSLTQNTAGNFTGASAGASPYTVRVTDSNNCFVDSVVTISEPPALYFASSTIVNVSCNGGTNGSIVVTAGGGTPGYQFSIPPSAPGTSGSFPNLPAGPHTIRITDTNGCIHDTIITITQPLVLSVSASSTTNVLCLGDTTGQIVMTSNGGTGTVTYTISPAATQAPLGTFTGLGAGMYTITGTDGNSCSATVTVTITQPASAVSITNITSTTPTCVPGCDATMTVTATGGTPGYSYSHGSAPAQSSNIFVNQCAGGYLVTVTDTNGCTDTMSHTISTPGSPTWGLVTTDSVDCNGGNDGGFTVNVNIGSAAMDSIIITAGPTTIPTTLSTASVTGTATGLVAGTYTVRAVDVNGCAIITNVVVAEPAVLAVGVVVVDSVDCNGGSDGGFTVPVTGGTPAYNYCINTSPVQCNSTGIFTGLPQALYTVTITDANSCTVVTNVLVNEPAALSYTNVTVTNVSCFGANDGSISSMSTGGTGILTTTRVLNLNPQTTQPANFTGLGGGTDTVRVTDANNCTLDSIVTISEPTLLVIDTVSTTQILCYGDSTGQIVMTRTGGTPNVTYTISPALGNQSPIGDSTINNLPANVYTITATDANSCTATYSVTITQPATPVDITAITGTTPSCTPGNDGTITVTASGGTGALVACLPPSTTTYPLPGTITGLGSSTYIVRVKDANGCFADTTYTITNSSAPTVDSVTTVMTQCNGDSTGSMIAYATGNPQASVTYQITAPFVQPVAPQASGAFNNLPAGIYTVTVNDANNCPVSTAVVITEPTAVAYASVVTDSVNCFGGNDGSIVIIATGGTAPYSATPVPNTGPSPNFTFGSRAAGSYAVQLTDANGCTTDSTIIISEPSAVTVNSVSSTNVLCNGDSSGSLTIVSSGGTGPITYSINTTPVQTNSTGVFNNLAAISYTVTSTDGNNCATTTSVTVSQPAPLSQTYASQNVSCFGGNDGRIILTGIGGVSPYLFGLLPSSPVVTPLDTFANLMAGTTYQGVVMDSNGCRDTSAVIIITEPTQIAFTSLTKQDIDCFGLSTGSISASVSGGTGQVDITIPGRPSQTSPATFNNVAAGIYIVTATDVNGCTSTSSITVIENPQIFFSSITNIEETCYGDGTAAITFQGAGGVGPYTYRFNGGNAPGTMPFNTQTTYTGLGGGTYQIEITDNLGCTYDSNYTLSGPDRINFPTFIITATTCLDTEDGKLTVGAAGGRGSVYNYSLEPGFYVNTSGIFRDLAPRQYTLRTTDTAGCFIDTIFSIPLPSNPMLVSITKEDLGCHGRGNEGKAEAVVTGGTPPYTYLWNSTPAQTTSRATGLYQGFHTVDVVDANGCLERDTVIIEPGPCCQEVFLPNAFSPNNDGRNDEFRILSTAGIELQQFEVRNRWGVKIWESSNTRSSWDGTYGGEAVNIGTYYYVLRYKCLTDGQDYTMKGDVIIVR